MSGVGSIVAVAAALAGLVLLIVGVRGRRVGDGPRCRRCGYDVSHSDGRCSECGAVLEGRAVARGTRRRRWRPAAAGLVLLLAGGALLAVEARRVEWLPKLPAAVLMPWRDEPDVRAELIDRLMAGGLTHSQERTIIADALSGAGSPRFDPAYLRILDSGRMDEAEVAAYVRAVLVPTLKLREEVRRGTRPNVAVQLDVRTPALGRTFELEAVWPSPTYEAGGEALPTSGGHGGGGLRVGGRGRSLTIAAVRLPAVEGDVTVVARVDITATASLGGVGPVTVELPGVTAEATVRAVDGVTTTELPAGLVVPLLARLDVGVTRGTRPHLRLLIPGGDGLGLLRPDMHLAAVQDGRTYHYPMPAMSRGSFGSGVSVAVDLARPNVLDREADAPDVARPMTVVVRPNLAALEATLEVEAVWAGELRIEGLSLGEGRVGEVHVEPLAFEEVERRNAADVAAAGGGG